MKTVFAITCILAFTSSLCFSQATPQTFEARFSKANDFYFKRDYKSCIQIYDEIIKESPYYLAAYYNRGIAKFYAGDLNGSQEDLWFVSNKASHVILWQILRCQHRRDADSFLERNEKEFSAHKKKSEKPIESWQVDLLKNAPGQPASATIEDINRAELLKKLTANGWKLNAVEEKNKQVYSLPSIEFDMEFVFKPDGSVVMTQPNSAIITGTWRYENDQLYISFSITRYTWVRLKFGVTGDLKLVDKSSGVATVFTKI